MLRKVNQNTITTFDSSYYAEKSDKSNSLSFTNAGDLVLTGSSFSGVPIQRSILTMKIDTNGKEKWRTFTTMEDLRSVGCDSWGNSIVQDSNGSYYIAGGTDNLCDTDLFSRGKDKSLLIRLDSNGNNVWVRKDRFSGYNYQNYMSIYNTVDGNLMCIGLAGKEVPNFPQLNDYQLLITKYDLEGNVIWYRECGNPDYVEYLYGSYISKDGGILITGRFEDNPIYDVQTYVMKLDACGCLTPGCDPNCLANGISQSVNKNQLKVFPNPAANKLSIESNTIYNHFSILNLYGQPILEGDLQANEINISELSKGLFILKLASDKEYVQVKFIKE